MVPVGYTDAAFGIGDVRCVKLQTISFHNADKGVGERLSECCCRL